MSSQRRHVAGSAGGIGGRWAEDRRPEAGGVRVGFADDRDLLSAARKIARREVFRDSGVDSDDLASDAVLAVLEERARTGSSTQALTGGEVAVVRRATTEMKLVRAVVARSMARSAATGHIPDGTFFKARRLLQGELVEFRAREHREPTVEETRRIADQVRLSLPPGRRPRVDFWTQYRHNDTDAVGYELPSVPGVGEVDTFEGFSAGSAGDRAHESLESVGGRSGRVAAVRLAWDAIAERTGAPQAAAGTISEERATTSRQALTSCGGPLSAARRFLDGDLDVDLQRHLFAPFGALSPSQRAAVAQQMVDFPSYAADLHSAALTAATARRAS